MVDGLSIVFTRKAVVDRTFIRKSSNLSKSIVSIDAKQVYSYSMCQPMPTGLYTGWQNDSETMRFTARRNNSRTLEKLVLSNIQRIRPDCKIESNVTTGTQNKLIAPVYMEFVNIGTLFLSVLFTTVPVKKRVPL